MAAHVCEYIKNHKIALSIGDVYAVNYVSIKLFLKSTN